MKRTVLPAFILGLAVTLIMFGLDWVGAFTSWERRSIDVRSRSTLRPRRPMTDEIVHVDIDDGALDRLGRWPWDRSRLADVLDELGRAGARTIAVDLVLTDAQAPQFLPEIEEPINHDARFAEAIGEVSCVLPVVVHEGPLYDDVWQSDRGREERNRLLEVLGRDIQLTESEVIAEAHLTGVRQARFTRRPIEFKRAAAWRTLESATPPPRTFEAFEQIITPRRNAATGEYPERPVLQSVWAQHQSWRNVQRHLVPVASVGTFKDRAPLPVLAATVASVGFVGVTEQKHPDGVVRELCVLLPTVRGGALQFGLAAAARHRGLEPSELVIDDDMLQFGDLRLPLHDERLWIWWPTSDTDPRWEGLLRRTDSDASTIGHVSIREIVELAAARRTQGENYRKLSLLTAVVLNFANIPCARGEEMDEANVAAAADEVEFVLSDASMIEQVTDQDETADPDEQVYRDHLHNCRTWRALQESLQDGRVRIESAERELAALVSDRLVFLGWTATGALADFVHTPVGARTPGVVVHAAIANMALTGRGVQFLPREIAPWITLLIGLFCTIAASRLPALPSVLVAGIVLAAYTGIAGVWLFIERAYVMPVTAPLIGGAVTWVACTALQAAIFQGDRRRITLQFRSRVSTQLVDLLVENPHALTMTGEEREITVLFADLAGFTAIVESHGGPTVVTTLNRYMGELTTSLVDRGAYVNKFLGDGLMAFWSAFALDSQQALKACQAALSCQDAVDRVGADPAHRHVPALGLRIGVATGRVVVGDCGAPPALNDYTVIGDAVNLASRLESANKHFETKILIDAHTRSMLDGDTWRVRPIGRITVVGRTAPVDVFELLSSATPVELPEMTTAAVDAFIAGDLELAGKAFRALDARFGPSPLSGIYLRAIEAADDSFDGVIRLHEK